MTEKTVKHVDMNNLTAIEATLIGAVSYLSIVAGVVFSVLTMRA